MADTYATTGVAPDEPAIGAVAINFSGGDQTVAGRNRWILLSTGGTLKVDMPRGDTVSLILAAGMWEISVTKIYQTGSSSAVGFLLY